MSMQLQYQPECHLTYVNRVGASAEVVKVHFEAWARETESVGSMSIEEIEHSLRYTELLEDREANWQGTLKAQLAFSVANEGVESAI